MEQFGFISHKSLHLSSVLLWFYSHGASSHIWSAACVRQDGSCKILRLYEETRVSTRRVNTTPQPFVHWLTDIKPGAKHCLHFYLNWFLVGWAGFNDSALQLNPFKAAISGCAAAITAKFTPFWKGTIGIIMMCETPCVLPMCCIITAYTGSKQCVYF